MCGIVGFVDNKPKSKKEKIIKDMADKIAHRGPDAAGYYNDSVVSLGHRRLSIIDLSDKRILGAEVNVSDRRKESGL